MYKIILKISILLFVIAVFPNIILYSQDTTNYICGTSSVSVSSPWEIPHKTPVEGEFLRVLVIHVSFPDDQNLPVYPNTAWPEYDEAPLNPYTSEGMIDDEEHSPDIPFMDRYTPYTYSDYWCQMSLGQWDFVGDEIFYMFPLTSSQCIALNYEYGDINRIVLEELDEEIDYTRYNLWSKVSNEWVFTNSDGVAEMIMINYRRVNQ